MREGLSTLYGHPLLRTLAIYSTVRTFCGGAFAALYMLYIVRALDIAPAGYGILVALGGVGALLGSLVMPHLTQRWGMKRTLIYGALLDSLFALLTPLASGPTIVLLGMLGISQLCGDIGFVLYALNEISLRQLSLPVAVQGRVNAVLSFLVEGIAPIGTLLAGIVSAYIGIRTTLLFGAAGMLLISIWLALTLTLTQHPLPARKPSGST
jgi:MFS family permease